MCIYLTYYVQKQQLIQHDLLNGGWLIIVRSEVAKVSAETGEMVKEKNKVEWEITEKQKKIISLETECSTLKQVLFLTLSL